MLAKAAKEAKVATQMGIQGHSMEGIRLICEWICGGRDRRGPRGGRLVHLSYYPWGHAGWSSQWSERPKETPPLPAGLELGPVDRPGADAAVPPGLPSGHVALLVGFRLRHDGRPRRAHARPGRLGLEARPADEHRRHHLRQHAGGASALGDRHVPVPRPARTCRR